MFQVRKAGRHYYVELMGATALLMISIAGRKLVLHAPHAATLWRDLVLLTPLVPILLMAAAIVRFYRRIDEMQRRQFLEVIAFGSLVCALGSLALGFLADVGLPHVGISWAWPLMGAGWLVAALWRAGATALADHGPAWTGRRIAIGLAIVAGPTLAFALAAMALGWPLHAGVLILVATFVFLAWMGWCLFRRNCA